MTIYQRLGQKPGILFLGAFKVFIVNLEILEKYELNL